MPRWTSQPLDVPSLDEGESVDRADVVFYGVDHSGPSYEARVYGGVEEAVAAAGGREAAIQCGRPVYTAPFTRPPMAWHLRLPISALSTETATAGMAYRARAHRGAAVGPPLDPPEGFRTVG